jgi:hypothetical protein
MLFTLSFGTLEVENRSPVKMLLVSKEGYNMKDQTYHNVEMKLRIKAKYKPPVTGRRHPHDKPRTAREYLEAMEPTPQMKRQGKLFHVDCTKEEANRFKPAAKRLGIRITQLKVAPNTVRVWRLDNTVDANHVKQ